jgi:TPP-dependent pyruvate/acetoin dehydrogenase alpha subunit
VTSLGLAPSAMTDRDGALGAMSDADLSAMLLIREFEIALLQLFAQGLVNGTTHTCQGQEYVAVSLAPLLAGDYVLSNHRGHGHYLARFDDPCGLLAEILGRTGSVCNGVGGSQHIWRPDYVSSGVQGQSVPIAAGIALNFRRTGQERLACAFIGDGTWGEGAVYEGLNLAKLWHLPLVLVVENNGIAQSTRTVDQMAGDVAGRAAAFGVRYARVDGVDLAAIRETLGPLLAGVREHGGPLVVEFMTRRLGPHSKGDDTRPAAEIARLREGDWHTRFRAQAPDRFDALEAAQRLRVAQVVTDVLERELSSWDGGPRG